jgi:hypothetical protein
MKPFRTFSALLGALVLASCSFEKNAVQDITGPIASARIKFFHFGVNAPGVNFYAGNAKVTAITSATGVESTTGVVYGGVGNGGFYSAVDPGQYVLTGKIAATVDKDLAVSPVTATIADGKAYSYFMSGIYNTSAKTVEGFVVEDAFPAAIDFTQAYVRFVNAISNSAPMTLFARNTTTTTEVPVGGLVAYKAGGAFTALPAGVYDLNTRESGATANKITRTAVSFVAGRVYTIGARGDITVVSTTATNRPFLDNTANR